MPGLDDDGQPKRRGRGRPRKYPLPEPGEPPAKRRKYAPRTPTLTQEEIILGSELDTPRARDGSHSDGDFLPSARRSDLNDETSPFSPAPVEENAVSPKTLRARTQSRSRPSYARTRSRGTSGATPRPRYSSAAAAAAATQASDGYKPREERSWEEFHPDLDIEAELIIYSADEVDGRTKLGPGLSGLRFGFGGSDDMASLATGLGIANANGDGDAPPPHLQEYAYPSHPMKRKPGRPPRRPESMLSGLGSPPAPRIVPLPIHNPKERLNLPKPSYRHVSTFKEFEENKKVRHDDYVDKSLANVGYQESELFDIPQQILLRHAEAAYDDDLGAALTLTSDDADPSQPPPQLGDVEYDMDEQDERWLEAHNIHRKTEQVEAIRPAMFEIAMTQIEREYYALEKSENIFASINEAHANQHSTGIPKPNPRHANQTRPRSSSAAAVNGEPWSGGDEPDSKCAICDDGDCENANAIIFCDGCDLAVHQECYGVPFIPEGQWFCRKCKEIGRGTPTCIFCPNIEGAFKQTNTLRWAHLLCAIWIPEVSIANPTYMEPIQDIEKVPRNRWGLVCYICEQRMGACIQCSNKACYQAFHVTCARRARLFLKMKASPTSGIDTTILKALCDRHVPPEWRRDHDTDKAIVDAKRYYRKTMRDRRWADSQTAALTVPTNDGPAVEVPPEADNAEKRKKKDSAKPGWRLPSGAPVVPTVVFTAVEQSLARFMLRKRKEFVLEACKYWTLKREARRGAALLKRLQLQLENFSTMEVTRRNFMAMGAAGRPRLIRRIEFADLLQRDIVGLQSLVQSITDRERKKLEDAENLKQIMDSVYFPVPELLWPILRKAQKLAEKSRIFEDGLAILEDKLADRQYHSIAAFSTDIGALFAGIVARPEVDTSEESRPQDINAIHSTMGRMTLEERQALSAEQKQQKAVAKRIVRAIKEPLESALRKESEMKGIPFEKKMGEWAKLGARLEASVATHPEHASIVDGPAETGTNGTRDRASDVSSSVADGAAPSVAQSGSSAGSETTSDDVKTPRLNGKAESVQEPSPPTTSSEKTSESLASMAPNPDEDQFLVQGGVPWYMSEFEPDGTTIHADQPDPTRAMSEILSEIDDAELDDMDINLASISQKTASRTPNKRNKAASATSARSAKKSTRTAIKAERSPSKQTSAPPSSIRTTRVTRTGSIASPAPSVNGAGGAPQSTRSTRTTRAGKKDSADAEADTDDHPSAPEAVDTGVMKTATSSRPRRGQQADAEGDEDVTVATIEEALEEEESSDSESDTVRLETDAERDKREKRERYNAKRRAARRKGF